MGTRAPRNADRHLRASLDRSETSRSWLTQSVHGPMVRAHVSFTERTTSVATQ